MKVFFLLLITCALVIAQTGWDPRNVDDTPHSHGEMSGAGIAIVVIIWLGCCIFWCIVAVGIADDMPPYYYTRSAPWADSDQRHPYIGPRDYTTVAVTDDRM